MPFNHEHLSKSARWPQTVAKNKAAVRFFEFRALKDSNAAIEWREIAKTGTNDEAMLMAEWALSTGNISYAISSVVAGQRWSALDYRFPKPFLTLYQKYSSYSNVPISFLYGISRQESMLNPDIKSPVGAVGLMQLMPGTAKMVSRKNNWSYSGTGDLVVPENNIRLGSAYLRDMLDRFDNNRILAAVPITQVLAGSTSGNQKMVRVEMLRCMLRISLLRKLGSMFKMFFCMTQFTKSC